MSQIVIIEEADAVCQVALQKVLKKEGLEKSCHVRAPGHGQAGPVIRLLEVAKRDSDSADDFTKPVRTGAVLAQVKRMLALQNLSAETMKFGAYTLNRISHELDFKGALIRLTEKESHILQLLAAQPGSTISRKMFLEDVWRYADGIETHTLETHIYRLRQKIEADPANPAVLLTDGAGYRLAD